MSLRNRKSADSRANVGVDRRNGGDAIQKGPDVQAGPADQDRQLARAVSLAYCRLRVGGPGGRRAGLGPVAIAIEAVGRAVFLFPRRPGGDDPKIAIALDRKSTRLNSRHYCATRMPSSA